MKMYFKIVAIPLGFLLAAALVFAATAPHKIRNDILQLGQETTDNKSVVFDIDQGAANPAIRANGSTQGLEMANDGVNFTPVAGEDLFDQKELKFYEQVGNGTDYIGFTAPDDVTATKTFKWPDGDGTIGQVMSTDGALNLGWVSPVTNPMDSDGDLIVGGGGTGAPTKLDSGADATVLANDGANNPTWQPVGVPPGAIMAYGAAATPTGWLDCDGAAVSSATYPKLFAAIGDTWGDGGDGAGPLFNVPDLNGRILKGASAPNDGNGGVPVVLGAYQADATAANGLSNATSSVTGVDGTVDSTTVNTSGTRTAAGQGGGSHGHTLPNCWRDVSNATIPRINSGSQWDATPFASCATTNTAHTHSTSTVTGGAWNLGSTAWTQSGSGTAAAQVISGDTETRVKVYGVTYIIKQ